ncbi:autoinhibited Ca2+-ATPase 11 [Prunus dulcis]|uniref:Autoinhibited Ca2+-ATPase 11 n=1 Tax=Prunus dulcis TaxID=3755 RepID=A0A4Y1RCG8_PRUDU|nr:autoinhibited Ca2+-ATPase 11 [Prunus dulcis]
MDLMFCHEFARQSFPLRASVTSAHNDLEDVFSKVRAQSSSASIPPDYVTGSGIDAHAIEVRSKLHPFAQKNLDENVLHLFENTLVLGPHWFGPVPAEVAELLRKDAEAPLCFESTSALASHSWVSKNLSRSFPSSEVRNSPVKWADWIDRLLPRYGGHWRRAGIYDAILLSKQSINRDENLLAAALCFWNSASNTFDFRVGPMAPTLLDMAQIFGFRPHGRPVDAVGDYHRRKNQEKAPGRSAHNHTDVGLGPTVLAHLFKNLHTATLENPLNLSAPGAFWMIQIWLQALHQEVGCSVASGDQKDLSLVPDWISAFREGARRRGCQNRLQEEISEHHSAQRSAHGGGKPPNYHLGAEVYHPNFCARQLGCPQLIPLKSYRSCNRALPGEMQMTWSLFCHCCGDLELPSADEEDDVEAEQTPAEAVPSGRRKRKGAGIPAGSPSPPPTKLKKLKKKGEVEYFAAEEAAAIPVSPSGTDDELREAFEEVEQEKELQELEEVSQKKVAGAEDDDEIPAEVIAESIALAQKQQKGPSAELTSSELALFEDAEAEHSTAVPEAEDQMEPSASDPVDQAELTVVVPEAEVGTTAAVPVVVVEVPKATDAYSLSSWIIVTASFADPELEEFEAMDLDAQLDRLEKLSSPPSKAKSRAVQEAMERLKIWQSTELEFDEDKGVLDQLMKDLDLLHRQNMAPKPILEMGLSLARDVLNLHDRYEDLKPTFKTLSSVKLHMKPIWLTLLGRRQNWTRWWLDIRRPRHCG